MGYTTIFFDLDGTLIDSRERLYRLFVDLAGSHNITFEEYWNFKRAKNSNEWILRNKINVDENSILKFNEQWMENIESDKYLAYDRLFPDTIDVLSQLFNVSSLYVITARQLHVKVMQQLLGFKIDKYFTSLLVTQQKSKKSDLITSLNLKDGNSIIVGDTGEDTMTGKELGLSTANVLTGFRNRTVLEAYHPDFIFDNLTQFYNNIISE